MNKAEPYPYFVETKILAKDIEEICRNLDIPIFTSAEAFADDLNFYYAGYLEHKRLHGFKKSQYVLTTKQKERHFQELKDVSKKFRSKLIEIKSEKDANLVQSINARLHLNYEKNISSLESLDHLMSELSIIIREFQKLNLLIPSDIEYESSSKQWFIAVAIPHLYQKHTHLKYTRAKSDTRSGRPLRFSHEVITYFSDDAELKEMTETKIDSTIASYEKKLKTNKDSCKQIIEYKFPFGWVYQNPPN